MPGPHPSGSSRFPAHPHPSGSSRFPAGQHPSDSRRLPGQHPSDSRRLPGQHPGDSGRLPGGPFSQGLLQQLPFKIVRLLGQGGMGRVFEALDASGRQVALKVLLNPGDGRRVQRLLREGTHAADLQHPNVARLLDVGLVGAQPYLSYELIEDARPLDRVLPELGLSERLRLLAAAADGVAHAHAHGITHRDLKPENILVDRELRPRVMDFGLSVSADVQRLTLSGAMLGTPKWMSPEQISGKRDDQGPSTDVWALGVMLYQALTDELPFNGDDMPTLFVAINRGRPTPPRKLRGDLSPELEEVCLRALQVEPGRRYPDAGRFRDALLSALSAPKVGGGRPRWLAPLGLVGGAALGFGAMATFLHYSRPSAGPAEPEPRVVDARGDTSQLDAIEASLEAGEAGAATRLAAFLQSHPDDPRAWRLEGEVHFERGDRPRAIEALHRSIDLRPSSKAYTGLGVCLLQLGRLPEAADALDTALELDPDSAYTVSAQALLLREQGLVEASLAAAERAIALEPGRAEAHNQKGVALQDLGDLPGAEAAYRKALDLGPQPVMLTNLGAVLGLQGRYDEARRVAAEARAQAPRDPRPHDLSGMIEFRAQRYEEALGHFDRALALDPDEVHSLVNRGWTLRRLGRNREARDDFERVLALATPGDANYLQAEKGLRLLPKPK